MLRVKVKQMAKLVGHQKSRGRNRCNYNKSLVDLGSKPMLKGQKVVNELEYLLPTDDPDI